MSWMPKLENYASEVVRSGHLQMHTMQVAWALMTVPVPEVFLCLPKGLLNICSLILI